MYICVDNSQTVLGCTVLLLFRFVFHKLEIHIIIIVGIFLKENIFLPTRVFQCMGAYPGWKLHALNNNMVTTTMTPSNYM